MTLVRFILFACLLALPAAAGAPPDYRNFYGACWVGTPSTHLKYARHMAYDYVVVADAARYRGDENARDLRFLIESPEYAAFPTPRHFDTTRPMSPDQRALAERCYAWKSNEPFPENLATGWQFSRTAFSPQLDFQQQAVIDQTVERIIALAKSGENVESDFRFGGYWWDVPDLRGDFWDKPQSDGGRSVSLAAWTGHDSCLLHPGITHEYATYSDGRAAFYKKLYQRTLQEFPKAKFIMEPFNLYSNWLRTVENRADRRDLMPDMLVQEGFGTQFVDDPRVFASGLITPDRVGSTQPDHEGEYENRLVAAKCATSGAWYSWSGRFGGTGNMPNFGEVTEVYPRLQLIRCLPNWDNLARVPLKDRHWDGATYESPNSHADPNVIYSRHPRTGKVFVVFLNTQGRVVLRPGETATAVHRADAFFMEAGDGAQDVSVADAQVSLKGRGIFRTNKGYVITVSPEETAPPDR